MGVDELMRATASPFGSGGKGVDGVVSANPSSNVSTHHRVPASKSRTIAPLASSVVRGERTPAGFSASSRGVVCGPPLAGSSSISVTRTAYWGESVGFRSGGSAMVSKGRREGRWGIREGGGQDQY